ncbi:serine protease [Staphylococcus condimenti]|uniref:Serine protease n=3 Tax=Staphylococcus TaxID=1279 RepID=A0A4Q7CJH2_9STAP|nr:MULTISPECIES: trypsin-like serine protease [Staphylococcus]MDK8644847.1 trypsin-like serine protease [Staphylococcus condimenti]PNZ57862.1 serine protease [Staphylococcus condimenti]QQS82337.1 trypsin-like peptidase domain-containing protein [Staphylococcus condimenti]QRP95302.1 trypsin-like peptidase domain-containing protein [Staphylococcus condimenti]RZI00225.1 serine protease [Staphylococcus condimenti]
MDIMAKKLKMEKLLYSSVLIVIIAGILLIFQNVQAQAAGVTTNVNPVSNQKVNQGQTSAIKPVNQTNTVNKANEIKTNYKNVPLTQSNQVNVTQNNQAVVQNKQNSVPTNKVVTTNAVPVKTTVVSRNEVQAKPQIKANQNIQTAPKVIQNKQPQKIAKAVNTKTKLVSQPVKKKSTTVATKPKQNNTIKVAAQKTNLKKTNVPVKTTKANTKKVQPAKKVTVNKKQLAPVNKKKVKQVAKPKQSKAIKAPSKTVKNKKTKSVSTKKVQFLAATTKSQPVKKATTTVTTQTKAKATPKPVPKVTPKPTTSNYYNQAPKRWPSNIPGSENVRDFGQTTYASGINDALKIMKASGNKGVTIEHTKAKEANIATVFNWNPTTKKLTYGTGTAIGKHTILTANHVVNDQQAHKPMSPSKIQNLKIDLLREGSKVARTVNVTGVKMMQYGDVTLLYTNEDLSKYMTIRKIAPESAITNIKANTPIHLYHYGLPSGNFKKDPMGTMYHSKGKYSMMARNVNPIGYYQMMAEPGSSGGAILNSKNEVLGVHAFRIASGEYQKYNLNTMAELRGNLRKEVIKNIK